VRKKSKMAAIIFVLLCLTISSITAVDYDWWSGIKGPMEITKITLTIWNRNYCGSNYGPYIEIQSKNGEKRNTYFHGPFSLGTTLIWDNNGENRYGGKNLGGVSGFQVKLFRDHSSSTRPGMPGIKFRIVGGGGDDFCPRRLTIYTKAGYKFEKFMQEWVDNEKGNEWRMAEANNG